MSRQKPAPKSRPSRRREPAATNQPPAPSDFASPPDATRDEFLATMREVREHNRPAFDALMGILRLDAPARSAALHLVGAACAAMPVPQPQPQRPLAQEALLLFAEITDPDNGWCTDEKSVDATVCHLILGRIMFGDRARAGLFLAMALEHASDEDLRDVVGALKRDRDAMHASIRERMEGAS